MKSPGQLRVKQNWNRKEFRKTAAICREQVYVGFTAARCPVG